MTALEPSCSCDPAGNAAPLRPCALADARAAVEAVLARLAPAVELGATGTAALADAVVRAAAPHLRSAAAPKAPPLDMPETAEAKLAAITAYCQQQADEFSASMRMRVRPEDIRVSAGPILAIIGGREPGEQAERPA